MDEGDTRVDAVLDGGACDAGRRNDGRARPRAAFDANDALTIGLEEEVLLLDPDTHLPIAVGDEVVQAADDPRIKRELPACQVEL